MLAITVLAAMLAVGIALDNGVGFVFVCGLAALILAQTHSCHGIQHLERLPLQWH